MAVVYFRSAAATLARTLEEAADGYAHDRRSTAAWRHGAGCCAASAVLSAQPANAAEPDPHTVTFASLKEAAAAGALDPGLVKPLEAGKPVTMFAVLDGAAAMKEYGNGNPKAVRNVVAALAAVRAKVRSSIEGPVEVLKLTTWFP